MQEYKDLVQQVLDYGSRREDRTGTGTVSLFGTQSRYDLRDGLPLCTLKKTMFKSIVKELLWILRGETNVGTLECGIWSEWADEDGDLDLAVFLRRRLGATLFVTSGSTATSGLKILLP